MKLAVSNIAWNKEKDEEMYAFFKTMQFTGLEIAPTRIFEQQPYEYLAAARNFMKQLKEKYNIEICSMQSIWYGRQERMFFDKEERQILLDYTKKAIDFAAAMNCNNLVFGCPKNRIIKDKKQYEGAVEFFWELGKYAYERNTVLAIEANPTIYKTNFINTTKEAFQLCKDVNSKGFGVNLDCGTVIENKENIKELAENFYLVNHIHLSEPYLMSLEKRDLYKILAEILRESNYQKFVSIEMKKYDDICIIKEIMKYVGNLYL